MGLFCAVGHDEGIIWGNNYVSFCLIQFITISVLKFWIHQLLVLDR